MGKMRTGICRLCGQTKPLSFEHIPPQSAFNDQPKLFQTMQDLLEGKRYSKFRRGIGEYSLCEACNNLTGGWYGKAFADWSRQGMLWLEKLQDTSFISLPFYIMPLKVIKQIVIMALAISSERTLEYHWELRKFALNKEQCYLPSKYKVHAYFNETGQPRFASGMVIMKVDSGHSSYVEAEVALPPFGYCITTNTRTTKSLADHQGLYNISWFARYSYNDWSAVYLKLPKRETHEPLPLDYRSKQEIEMHYQNLLSSNEGENKA